MQTNTLEALVKLIVEILNDQTAFTNKSEVRVETALADAYRAFAEEHGFSLDVVAKGMREGFGAFCGYPPEDYLVRENNGPKLEIWISRRWSEQKQVRVNTVLMAIQDERLDLGQRIENLLKASDIETRLIGSKERKREVGIASDQLMADLDRFDSFH